MTFCWLAGDLDQLSGQDVTEHTGLVQVTYHNQPTRGASKLGRLFVSDPHICSTIHVVTSVMKATVMEREMQRTCGRPCID